MWNINWAIWWHSSTHWLGFQRVISETIENMAEIITKDPIHERTVSKLVWKKAINERLQCFKEFLASVPGHDFVNYYGFHKNRPSAPPPNTHAQTTHTHYHQHHHPTVNCNLLWMYNLQPLYLKSYTTRIGVWVIGIRTCSNRVPDFNTPIQTTGNISNHTRTRIQH